MNTNIDEVIGYFTYRSFRDEPVGAPNDILWGEGEMLLLVSDEGTVTGTLAFPAEPGTDRKEIMDLTGTVTAWQDLSFRFVGKGRVGTSIFDYEYEYDCKVVHEWESANPPQRLCLVGSVRRNKDHGQAKAGATASFVAVKRDFTEPRSMPGVALLPEVVAMLSERTHRLRHTVWHTLRSDWRSPNMTDNDRKRLKDLGWHLADPPFMPDGRTLDLTNGAGEDFLFMHRRMIRMVNDICDGVGKPRPNSWKELPDPATPQFAYREAADPANPQRKVLFFDPANSGSMTPPPTKEFLAQVGGRPFFRFNKTPRGFANMMRMVAENLRNPRVLCQLTLGAYGNYIEFTVHNWMHMRFASLSRNPVSGVPEVRDDYNIDPIWDVPQNDYLGDFHSSHVNPVFWKLHGWVDDCIEIWYEAHVKTHPSQVRRKEVSGIPWFDQGPWVLKADPFDWPMAGHSHDHEGDNGNEMKTLEEVMMILKEVSGKTSPAGLMAVQPVPRLSGFARFSDVEAS